MGWNEESARASERALKEQKKKTKTCKNKKKKSLQKTKSIYALTAAAVAAGPASPAPSLARDTPCCVAGVVAAAGAEGEGFGNRNPFLMIVTDS